MTTNHVQWINLVLKKSRNLPINALVKSTHVRCNMHCSTREEEKPQQCSHQPSLYRSTKQGHQRKHIEKGKHAHCS